MATERRCLGRTKTDEQCKRMASDGRNVCYQHRAQHIRELTVGLNLALAQDLSPAVVNYARTMQGATLDYDATLTKMLPVRSALSLLASTGVSEAARWAALSQGDNLPKWMPDFATIDPTPVINSDFWDSLTSINRFFEEQLSSSAAAPVNAVASQSSFNDAMKWLRDPSRVQTAMSETTAEEIEAATEEAAKIIEQQKDEKKPASLARNLAADPKVTTHALMCLCLVLLVHVTAQADPRVAAVAGIFCGYLLIALDERIKQIKEDHDGDGPPES